MIPDDALLQWTPGSPAEAQALVQAVQASAQARGVALPSPPTAPDNCCGNDCVECVWLGHYSEVGYWRDEAVLRWAD